MAQYKGAYKEGSRAMILMKKREKEVQETENRKRKIEEELAIGSISNKFASQYDSVEQRLKSETVGLISLEDMKAKQEDVVRAREQEIASNLKVEKKVEVESSDSKSKKNKAKQKTTLSFDMEEFDDEDDDDDDDKSDAEMDENDDNESLEKKRKRLGMNPDVDTSFLPDVDRELEEAKLREKLCQEWVAKQEQIKNEEIDITYSYWDGSGHRRNVRMKKGNTIQQFLQRCMEQLRKEFNELKTASVDQLMYVKEDLIIPQHNSFYDFIVTKARGKSGPLFNFDVHDDIRLINDSSVEKDESHAGKVCLRSWYERNKHIFPASRWEPFDPEKKWDKYTVSDKESAKVLVK